MIEPESIARLKQIPIADYLESLSIIPISAARNELAYSSPKTEEKTPSFYVNQSKNVFHDFSGNERGDIIRLVQYLTGCSFLEAVRVLENFTSRVENSSFSFSGSTNQPGESNVKILTVKPLQHPALIRYVTGRGISFNLAFQYLKEVHYELGGKQYFALGFENDMGGYELRNAHFKGCTSPKWFCSYKGSLSSDSVCLFEGFFDFLSALQYYGLSEPRLASVVLNSTTNLAHAIPHLEGFKQIKSFLDNDAAGQKAAASLITKGLCVVNQSKALFPKHKDFNHFITSQTL